MKIILLNVYLDFIIMKFINKLNLLMFVKML